MIAEIIGNLKELDKVYLEIGDVGEDTTELSEYVTELWINEFTKLSKQLGKLSDLDELSLEFLEQVMHLEQGVVNFVNEKDTFINQLSKHDFNKDGLKSKDSNDILIKGKEKLVKLVSKTLNDMVDKLEEDTVIFGIVDFTEYLDVLMRTMWRTDINEFFAGMISIWYFNNCVNE